MQWEKGKVQRDVAQELRLTNISSPITLLMFLCLGYVLDHWVEHFCLILIITLEAESILLIHREHTPCIRTEAGHVPPQKYLSRSATPSRSDHGNPQNFVIRSFSTISMGGQEMGNGEREQSG